MKNICQLLAVLVVLGSMPAWAGCLISVQACPRLGVVGAGQFEDHVELAKIDPHQCLKRAREYLNYCAVPNQLVGAYFRSGDRYTTAVLVNATASQLFGIDVSGTRWQPLNKDY